MNQDITMVRSLEATKWTTIPSPMQTTSVHRVEHTSVVNTEKRPRVLRMLAEHYYTVIACSIRRSV